VLIDDSEKFGHAATVVMFICLMKDKSIQSRIASLLTAATKKAEGAFRELYTFLLDTFGWEQLLLITSGTTDGFGAACVTMGLLLKAIDALCSMHPHVVKTIVADNGVEFFLSEAVRQERARKCFMHAWDRVFNNFFEALLQKKGLGDDGSTSQNIYSIHYWEKKFKPKFDALIMESVDMNSANAAVERKKLEACSKLLDEIRESRWLSRENVCLQLVGAMNVEATQLFQDKVKAYFDSLPGHENTWAEILKFGRCFNSDKLSHLFLAFMYLCNHSSATPSKAYWLIVGFLGSPTHRIATYLGSVMQKDHIAFATFVDGKSNCREDGQLSRTYSTLALEEVPFMRKTIARVYAIANDFFGVFPEAAAVLRDEAQRAEDLQMEGVTKEIVIDYFKNMVSEHSANMKSQADAYFRDQTLTLGFMVQYLIDYNTAPHAAVVLLDMLQEDGCPDTHGRSAEFVQLPTENLQVDPVWNVYSDTHAYPGMTWKQFRECLASTLRANADRRAAIFKAYALKNPLMILDLVSLACGEIRNVQGCTRESLVPEYIVGYRSKFPTVSAMFEVWFASVSITTTAVEQAFSVVASRGSKAKVMATMSDDLMHLGNVRSACKYVTE
jgi:hypothetical protein